LGVVRDALETAGHPRGRNRKDDGDTLVLGVPRSVSRQKGSTHFAWKKYAEWHFTVYAAIKHNSPTATKQAETDNTMIAAPTFDYRLLIVVTYCPTPDEQAAAYSRIH
jgi:hypothetical protein